MMMMTLHKKKMIKYQLYESFLKKILEIVILRLSKLNKNMFSQIKKIWKEKKKWEMIVIIEVLKIKIYICSKIWGK